MMKELLEAKIDEFKVMEEKNREVADKWLDEVVEIIKPVSLDLWGDSEVITHEIEGVDSREANWFMLCYYEEDGNGEFIFKFHKNVKTYKGDIFWDAFEIIVNWVKNELPELLEDKKEERKEIMKKINIDEF